MTLVKTSLLSSVSVALKILALLGINKVLAIYVGSSGYALLGQFQNLIQLINTVSSGAINTGVVKYTAEYKENHSMQIKIWRAAGLICLVCSLLTAIFIFMLSTKLAEIILHDAGFFGVFVCLAIALPFSAFNLLLLSVLNGKKEIQYYVVANIAGSLLSLSLIFLIVTKYGLYGALISLAIYQSLAFVVTYALCRKAKWFSIRFFLGNADCASLKKLLKYTVMALVTAICVPVSHMLIRADLITNFGMVQAGHWDAMWRFSSAYLMFVTVTLSVYFLPKISELITPRDLRRELINGYQVILPLLAFVAAAIYFSRTALIEILFTAEFAEMQRLFFWQLTGDFLKVASWILGIVLVAKAEMLLVVLSEIFFSFSFFFLIKILSGQYGLEAAAISHAINYAFHFMFMICVLKLRKII